MKKSCAKRATFPHYLKPGPNNDAVLGWFGNELKLARGSDSEQLVAERGKTTIAQIKALERGQFHLNLGQLREIIERGYTIKLPDLLRKCYDEFRDYFDPGSSPSKHARPFDRDGHYSMRLEDSKDGKEKSTPLLIGGVPDNYLWAIPIRRLNDQPVVTELLELAPSRKLKKSGVTPDNSHDGVEVIHVIHGTVQARFSYSERRQLKAGDSIHFRARNAHQIENAEKSASALLLVVRLPELPNETPDNAQIGESVSAP